LSGRVVEVFADVVCPFTHVGLRRFVQARADAGAADVALRVRAWPLEVVNGEPLAADFVAEEIDDLRAQVAPDLFVGFDPDTFPGSTIALLGLAEVAYAQGLTTGESLSLVLRDALFERGRPVADPSVLSAMAADHGLTVPDADTAAALVEASYAEGRKRGVIGSPHFFLSADSWFCPGLDIERRGHHLHIRADEGPFKAFLADAFA
jgi:predicted DsbA family dithiol-disulfide isomerase